MPKKTPPPSPDACSHDGLLLTPQGPQDFSASYGHAGLLIGYAVRSCPLRASAACLLDAANKIALSRTNWGTPIPDARPSAPVSSIVPTYDF